jgi:hypothetical protein
MAPLALKPAMVGKDRPTKPGCGALGAELLVDGQFGDAFATGHRGLEPGVEAAHGQAVLHHGLADEGGLLGCLAALGQGAGVGGLHHLHARGHGLAQAQGDAARVHQQGAAGRQGGQGAAA